MRRSARPISPNSRERSLDSDQMRITGLHHVQVAITPGSEPAARRFYGELLGLVEIEKPAALGDRGGVWFACGGQQLHCGVEPSVAPSRRHPALLTDDLAATRTRLVEAGVPVRDDRQIPGYHRFYAEDPFGNRVELLQPV
jgi:catechol 2,3-dioxygenase-like lactoylglutathione lyase family enzyme